MTTLFYITDILLLLIISAILIFMYGRARRLKDVSFQLRRRSFIAFYILLGIHIVSSFDIVTADGTEVLATFAICTLYAAFTTFMMLSSAYFGRKYHRNTFIWFFLLQYPAILLILHLFSRFTGRYSRVYSMDDIWYNGKGLTRFLFAGRLIWLAIVIVGFLFMICMLIDAYHYYMKNIAVHTPTERKTMSRDEILDIAIYAVLLVGMMVSFMMPYLLPHIITNILMACMVFRTYYVYYNFLRYSENMSRKQTVFVHISQKLLELSEQEHNNPIYHSNSNLDEVADALKVEHQDFSDYLYERLHTSFSAWMSEMKIKHFTQQLTMTDRKISELSAACGYSNVSSLNRAFKANFGMTPSKYREKHL